MDRILIALGTHLRKIRKAKGMTQETLAEQVNIHQTYVGKLESGKRNPSTLMLFKISRALGISLAEIFDFDK